MKIFGFFFKLKKYVKQKTFLNYDKKNPNFQTKLLHLDFLKPFFKL